MSCLVPLDVTKTQYFCCRYLARQVQLSTNGDVCLALRLGNVVWLKQLSYIPNIMLVNASPELGYISCLVLVGVTKADHRYKR
jgi:hypothetical protein